MSYDDVRKQLMQATYKKNTGSQATQEKSAASTPAPARSSGYDDVYAQLESSLGSDARLRDARNRAGQDGESYENIVSRSQEQQKSYNTDRLSAQREGLIAEYRKLGNGDSIPITQKRNQLRAQIAELDKQLGVEPQDYTFSDRSASVVGGSTKQFASGYLNFVGTGLDFLKESAIRLGGNADPYAGYATDEFSAAQLGYKKASEEDYADITQWVDKLQSSADRLGESANAELQKAKSGLGKLGQAGVDIAANVLQMGYDAAIGRIPGVSSLGSMFVRSAGSAAQEARQQGANVFQQAAYGAASGGVEVLTEKMFDGVAKIYGAGAADDVVEELIRKLTKSDFGRTALRWFAGAAGEGIEEVVSDLVAPYAETIYNGKSVGDVAKGTFTGDTYDLSEILYDFVIGAAIGGLGGATSIATGEDAKANRELLERDAGIGNVDSQANDAWEVLAGRRTAEQQAERERSARERLGITAEDVAARNAETQAENLTDEPTEEQKKQNRTETMRGILSRSSEAAGVQMTDEEATAIAEGYEAGTNGRLYAAAATDAYKLGKSGKYTLEEAMKASQYTARLSADQFRNAFEAGAGTETNAVDASTEDGKQTLTAALSSLGEHAEEAANAYEAGQDVSRFAAGMSEAAERYAITGADIRAQEGGIPAESVISTLTDAQIEKAQEIGGRLRETRAAAVSQLAEQRKAIRAHAQAIEQQGAADTAALTEVNRQIREANKIGRETVEMFEAQRDALTKAVEADPDFQNTEEYAKAFDEAKENMERAVELQKSVEELQARKKEIEGKAPVKRKKGTVSLDGGNIAGTDYAGIDRSKLTRQQQNIVAMVERLADFINIDYVVFDGPANMGGAYMQGGRLYININAGMTQEGRKSIAAASLSHELTHFMQEYAPEEYQQLKDYVIGTILNKSQTEFDRMIRQQRRWEPGKSYDELADELVANACQTMLTDDKAVQRMARSNMTLAQKVADVLDEIGEKIRKAFEGLSFDEDRAIFAPVKAVMDEIDGITERWADGISAAVENYNAEQTVKNRIPVAEALQDRKLKFQMTEDVEATDRLVAVHNKSVSGLRRMLQRGGVPFPSIAIKKAGSSHEGFGDVSIVFPRSTIDPAASRWNRLYSNDAWTPTEPRTEYDVGDTWKLQQRMEQEIGTEIYRATKLGSYLEKNQLERDLSTSEGDVVKALKGRAGIKYAYLKSIGQEPKAAQREKPLDGFGRYKNAQLLAVFDSIPASELKAMDYDSTETLQKVADALNQQWLSSLPTETAQRLAGKRPLYSADKINPQIIKDALRNYENNGRAMESEVDDTDLERQLRDNKALEDDPKYQAWIRERFNGLIKDSGIPNGKGVYTDTGNRRSFKARHVPATLENIVQQMRKEQEKGIGLVGINLRGAATKAYRSVEEMRAESGKLLGARVFDEEYDSYMKEFGQRLNDLTETADKVGYDTAKQTLLEAVRDSKSKPDMQRRLQNESRWINYSDELTDDLWQLRNDVQNMPAPYFEAKPRRVVSPDEALAYIIPDNAGSDIVNDLESRGYNVMTYKAGNEQDRLAKLNSVEGAQFQRFDDAETDEQRMNELDAQIRDAEDRLDGSFDAAEQRTLENRLTKLYADRDQLIAKERRLSRRTSINDILDNLSNYRMSDLRSLAEQMSDGAWDIEDGISREDLEAQVREALEERAADMTTLERQAPRAGLYVRPVVRKTVDTTQDREQRVAGLDTREQTRVQFQKWDDDYAQAVQNGDTETEKKLVAQAAKRAGYQYHGYHGTLATDFTEFKKEFVGTRFSFDEKGFFFIDRQSIAKDYATSEFDSSRKGRVIDAYLRIRKPLVVDKAFVLKEGLGNIFRDDDVIDAWDNYSSYFIEEADNMRADGIIVDDGSTKMFVVFDGEQIKSADPVTYDDAGNVIPLSSRFNRRERDFRFQRFDDTSDDTASESRGRDIAYSRLQSENAILSETVAAMKKITSKQDKTIAALQKRLQVTTTPEVRQSDARKLARQLIRENGSKADAERVSEQLKALGDYILQTETAKLDENEMKSRARAIASEILNSATEQISAGDDTFQRIAGEIKGRKLSIDEDFLGELDQAGGYDAFRKSVFGSFTLAKRESASRETRDGYMTVDQFYTDMQGAYGKGLFPDVANEGEQVQILARMLDAAKPMEVNPFEQYMGEATEEMANRIVMDAMNGVLRQTAPTTADRQKARTQALKEQIDQLKAENKLEQREAASLYHTVYDLTVALDKAASKYQTLRTEANYRAAQLRAEGTARAAEIKAAERERAAGQIAQLKAHYQEMRKSAKARREESAGVTKYRKQVEKKAKKLYEMLMTNSNDLHVPEVLKAPLGEFLESLDFSSKRSLAGGEDTVADANFGARLVRIQQMLDNQQRYIDGDGSVAQDLGGYIDVSPEILEYLRGMAEMITTAMSTGRTFTVNQMTAADLKTLSDFMSNLRTAINNMNRFMANARYASVQTAAQADIERMKRLGKASEASASAAVRFAGWENGTPYYIMKRLGTGAKSIFDGFAKGWERLAFNAQEIIDFTKDLYTDEEVRDWKRDIHEITLSDGSKVKMTTAQIMELSMLLGREQAVKHITRGGIRIGDIETKRGTRHDTAHYHLSDEDIQSITGMLTARQMEVAKKMQRFMAEKGAEWGNEVSMRRFGYKFYEEGPGYYPIKTDSNDRPMADTDAQTNSMFRLLNLSSSKALNPKASNALVVGGIFDTFADHMSDMAKLNGMGLPILDAIKWFNYKERVNHEDGTYDTVTLQGAMEEAFGEQAQRYFRTLMKDINGVNESGDRGTSLPTKMMSNYKIAAVAANLRVAFLQPTSYVRASTVLKPKHMIGILPSKAAYREAMKYSGTAVWKSLGYYETDISKSMRQQITHDDSFKDKVADKSMALAELGDQSTWSMLWQACKRQAKAESPALSHDALMEKTAALFREVVYSSQVMDSTLTRSEIMRGKTGWTKAMSAFMAEPTLSYNILMDAASELDLDVRENGKEGAWKRNSGKIGKAVSVYVASAAFSAVVESIADAIRDDDDEDFWEKFNQALWGEDGKMLQGNFAQDLTILGKIPYVKNFISTLQGYQSGDMSVAAFNSLVNVYNIWAETIKLNTGTQDKATKITYYGKMTEWGKVQKTLQALSQLSGYAVYNLTRDATAIWNTAMDVAGKQEWKIRTYDADRLSQSKLAAYNEYVKETGVSKRQFQSILTAADTSGNGSLTQDELGTELSRAVKAGEITNAQAEAIWKTKWNGENSKTFAKWSGAAAPSQGKATATGKTEKPAGSSMSFEDFKKTATVYDKEAVYNGYLQYVQPLGVNLADFTQFINEANTDGNSSVKQAELGEKLYEAVQSGQMTEEEANAWFLVFWNEPGSKTYTKWAAKNKK